jgi:hypothetical protein
MYDRDLNLAPRYDFMTLPQIAECRPPPRAGLTRVGLHTVAGQGEEACSSRRCAGRPGSRHAIILLKADLRRAGRIRYTGRRVCVRGVVCASGASCVRQGRRVCVRGVVCASGASSERRSGGAAEWRSGGAAERRRRTRRLRGALHAASRRVTSGWGERVRGEQGLEVQE